MRTVFVNGKFTAQPMTGVQRVASNLLRAVDRRLAAGASPLTRPWVLLCPAGAPLPELKAIEVRRVGRRVGSLHAWEQWALPRAARTGLLLNLAGSAPWFARAQVCMLHDAAVFDHPRAYTWMFRHWYSNLFRHLARRAERVLTVSDFSRRRLSATLGLAERHIGVVPNGSDHLDGVIPDDSVLRRHGLVGVPYLLAVGSANPTKNHTALRAAFAQRPAVDAARLVIVGGADARVFAVGDGAGVSAGAGQALQVGRVDDAQLKALYQQAVGLVFPSLYEGFGLPALEAMACGCPVAAADAAALPEVCGGAALLFDPHSVSAIAAAMHTLLSDAGERGRLRARGHARALAFRWDAAAGALLAQLARVA